MENLGRYSYKKSSWNQVFTVLIIVNAFNTVLKQTAYGGGN